MRRRLGAAPAAPLAQSPPAQAPLQQQAPPTQQAPLQGQIVHQPQNGGGTNALALPPDLMALGAFQRTPTLLPAQGEGSPYIGFHSNKANNASDVLRALGSIPEGTPYLSYDGQFFNATQFSWLIIQELPHWVTLGGDFQPDRCWLTPQPFGRKLGEQKVSEQILTVLLVLPGQIALPETIAPAVATCTTFRATKAKAARQHLDAVEATLKPEWAQQGVNGHIAGIAPPRFRIASTFAVENRTARSGFAYALAEAISATIQPVQMQALAQWGQNPDCQAELQAVLDAFEQRAESLRELAAETKD